MSSNSKNSIPIPGGRGLGPTNHLITSSAVALRLHRRLNLVRAFQSSLQSVSSLGFEPVLKDIFQARALQFAGFNYFQWPFHALSATVTSLSFFNGDEIRSDSRDVGKSFSRTSRNDLFGKRQWTNILLAANVLAYLAQTVSEGKLLFWGAKINSLISEGQLWRLATSSFLHANIGHLMVNCYSLNSVGPTVEDICGPKRYLAIYITSAIASSVTSYWFCKAPAVGASGAIFGLVGSFALFILRHRGIITGSEGELRQIAKVIALNMVTLYHGLFCDFLRAQGGKFIDIVNQAIGLLSQGIDNWGHVGGLLGGAAVSWFLGPAWKIESISRNGRNVLTDKAPIFSFFKNR